MDELFTLHTDQVFLRREALAHGYDDRDLRSALKDGALAKVRHGAYVPLAVWDAADDLERHRLRAHAVVRSHGTKVALSHTSAAIEQGLRLYQPALDKVHVLCLDKPLARSTPDVVYHRLPVGDAELRLFADDVLAVNPLRAALETAALSDIPSGLVVLDGVLHLEKLSLEELHEAFDRYRGPGSRRLQITVRLARPGSESAGESLGRHLFWRQHLPEPVLQLEVRDSDGHLVGRTDYAWPQYKLFGEFDGLRKYLRTRLEGESIEDAVIREKKREDALREITGWMMIRFIWADLHRPRVTGARLQQQLDRGRRLAG